MLEVKFKSRRQTVSAVADPPDRRKSTRKVETDGKTSKGGPKLSEGEIKQLMETNVKFRRRVIRQTERSIKADELAVARVKNLETSIFRDTPGGNEWIEKTQRSIQDAYSKKAIPVLDIGAESVEKLQEMVAVLELKDSVKSQKPCEHGHMAITLASTWVVFKPQQCDFDDYSNRQRTESLQFNEVTKVWTRKETRRIETPCPKCLALKEMQRGLCPHNQLADGKVKGTSVENANVEWRFSGCAACKLVKSAYGERWVRK